MDKYPESESQRDLRGYGSEYADVPRRGSRLAERTQESIKERIGKARLGLEFSCPGK